MRLAICCAAALLTATELSAQDTTRRTPPLPAGVMTDAQVEKAVTVVSCSVPKYPPALRAVGISGAVYLRYIVGADGVLEVPSIFVLSSTNREFVQPAIDAIKTCTFTAARIQGAGVRQIVDQHVRFALAAPVKKDSL